MTRRSLHLLVALPLTLVVIVLLAVAFYRRETTPLRNAKSDHLHNTLIYSSIDRTDAEAEHPQTQARLIQANSEQKQSLADLSESQLDEAVGRLIMGMAGGLTPSERLGYILSRLRSFDQGDREAKAAYVALVLINRRAREFDDVMFEVHPSQASDVLSCAATILASADQPRLRLEAARAITNYYQTTDDVRRVAAHLTGEVDSAARAGMLDALREILVQERTLAWLDRRSEESIRDAAKRYGVDSSDYECSWKHEEKFRRRREARRELTHYLQAELDSMILDVVSTQSNSSPAPEVASVLAKFVPDLAQREPTTASTLWGWVAAQPEAVQASFVKNIPAVNEAADTILLGIARRAETPQLIRAAVWTMVWNCDGSRRAEVVERLISEPRSEIRFAAIIAVEGAATSKVIDRVAVRRVLESLSTTDAMEEVRKRAAEALQVISPSESSE